ncbi:AAA family ATPase, partial [bacterium]|nr:AAA family ATPase [bacterium]
AMLITIVNGNKRGISKLSKPEKLYLNNTNIFYALGSDSNRGTIRETFFLSQLQCAHSVEVASKGDFIVDKKYLFEIGGEGKSFHQIRDIADSYLAIDTDSTENDKKIPLWLFGFLY